MNQELSCMNQESNVITKMEALDGNHLQLELSTDEVLNELIDKDSSVEVVGYVSQIFRPQEVGQSKKYHLFKFILATSGIKKITCLIWGLELIDKFQSEITSHRILHIDGAHCKATILNSAKIADNFVPYELIIQKTSVVEYLGVYGLRAVQQADPIGTTFENIHHLNGTIIIKGFIKMKFVAITNRFDNATYGSGSITDGEKKINVKVTNYSPINIEKGTAVIVTGEINDKNGFISLTCLDSSKIKVDEEVQTQLTNIELMRAVRSPKRVHSID